jgi:hypothetical protein
MAKIITPINFAGGSEVAKNSLSVLSWDPIAIKSGFADKAVAGDKIEWYATQDKTFDSDNQTVKKAKLEFARTSDDFVAEYTVENGTIVQANIGATYNLNANSNVDGATSATGTQVTLRKVKSSTLWDFVRAK